jgi:hypothetical protein
MQQPHSLGTIELYAPKAPKPLHADIPPGQPWPVTQIPFCPRRKVADFPAGFLKQNHIKELEQNQKLASCCRHPENHEVEARKSKPSEPAPDIYWYHCTCGKKHQFFCVGQADERPVWK